MRSASCRKGLGWPRTAPTWTPAQSPAARGPTTANSREGSGTQHKPGQPSAIDPCKSSNPAPPHIRDAGWPQHARGRWGGRRLSGPGSAQRDTQAQLRGFKTLQVEQLPPRTERLCMPNAPAFSCGPRERSPRGRQLQRVVGRRTTPARQMGPPVQDGMLVAFGEQALDFSFSGR
jgi:hypothetical protein